MEKVSTVALGKAATKLSETDPDVKGVSSATDPHTEMFNWGSGLRGQQIGPIDRHGAGADARAAARAAARRARAVHQRQHFDHISRNRPWGGKHDRLPPPGPRVSRIRRDAPATSALAGWPPRARHARERCPLDRRREVNVRAPSKASVNSLPSRPRRRRRSGQLPTWLAPTDGHPRPVGKPASLCVALPLSSCRSARRAGIFSVSRVHGLRMRYRGLACGLRRADS